MPKISSSYRLVFAIILLVIGFGFAFHHAVTGLQAHAACLAFLCAFMLVSLAMFFNFYPMGDVIAEQKQGGRLAPSLLEKPPRFRHSHDHLSSNRSL